MLVRTLRHRLSLSAPKRHPADVLVSHLTWKAVYCAHSGGQRSLKGTQLCVTMTILIGFLLFMMNLQVSAWCRVGDGGIWHVHKEARCGQWPIRFVWPVRHIVDIDLEFILG